jgi:hypothetical protein
MTAPRLAPCCEPNELAMDTSGDWGFRESEQANQQSDQVIGSRSVFRSVPL